MARLHSAFWGDHFGAYPSLAWVEPFVAWTGMAIGIDMGVERAGDLIPVEVRGLTGEEIESGHWARYVDTLGDGSQTLLHGDAHIGNTYVLPDDEVGFLDWQVLRRGNSSLDLGYFLQGAVTIDDRRACERDLVEEYCAALVVGDEDRPTFDDVWRRYRASAAHGLALWLATAASDTWQRTEVSVPLAARYATAFVDLESVAAVDSLTRR
jgi:Ser/Thr protein kinase RdoA (MazF antagonist)